MGEYTPFLQCISSFEETHKNLYNTSTRSLFLMILHSVFTSADIIFHNLFELHSTLLDKRILSQNLLAFLTDSLKTPRH